MEAMLLWNPVRDNYVAEPIHIASSPTRRVASTAHIVEAALYRSGAASERARQRRICDRELV
jgi:hypothetical protein